MPPKKNVSTLFSQVKSQQEAQQLREKLVKFVDENTGPNGIDACIVDVTFDNKNKRVTGATVKHYDHQANRWLDETIDVGVNDLSKYF